MKSQFPPDISERIERTGVIDIVGDGLVFARRDAALLAAHAE